jgi:hypothetical protein
MNATVLAAIEEELAALERVAPTPSAPFGYGVDLRCASDLTETMEEVEADSTLAIAEAQARRLDCPRGGIPDDPDYGISLPSMLNRGTTADDLRALAAQVRSELEKDDRVDQVGVTMTPAEDGGSFTVQTATTPIDPAVGGFRQVLAVTSAAVLIEELR